MKSKGFKNKKDIKIRCLLLFLLLMQMILYVGNRTLYYCYATDSIESVNDIESQEQAEEPKLTKEPEIMVEIQSEEGLETTISPEITEESKPTQEPKTTEEPKPTHEQKVTEEPKPTEEPKQTEEPKPSQEPKVTEEPISTEKPTPTDSLESTEEPKSTVIPEPTNEPAPNKDEDIEVTDIDLGDFQKVMKVGEKQLLGVSAIPLNATQQIMSFISSDEKVATINGMGRITAVSEGQTTIKVVCGSVTRSFKLSIEEEEIIKVEEIDIGDVQEEMTVGEHQILSVALFPANAVDQEITYSSSKTKVATINSMGRITACSKGKTTITVKCGKEKESFELNVKEKIKAKDLDLGDYQEQMKVNDRQMLYVTVMPTDAVDQKITYSSSDESIARINSLGRITALSVGETTITAKCGMIKKSFNLTVKEADIKTVTKIEIGEYEDEMYVDKTQTLSVTVLPTTAIDATVTYTSKDAQIATVLSNGQVKGVSKGKTTIIIKAGDITKEIEITVKVPTKKIEVNCTYIILKPGESYNLNATAIPSDAPQEIQYRVINNSVATISSSGVVTANEIGNTSIIVSNGDISRAVTIIVNEQGIVSDEDSIEIIYDDEIAYADVGGKDRELLDLMEYRDQLIVEPREYALVSKPVLKKLLETSSSLIIDGKDYKMIIYGNEIVNFENELATELELNETEQGKAFILNNKKNLPCNLTILLKNEIEEGSFIYLYNDKKDKYQLLDIYDMNGIVLDEAGEYLITEEKISKIKISIFILGIVGGVSLVIVGIYIVVRKKYWFY